MATHSLHEPIHLFGLADGCEACEEAAKAPWKYLDADLLHEIVVKVTDPDTRFEFRSDAEAIAFKHVLDALEHAGQLYSAARPEVEDYLTTKWGGR